MKAFFKQGATVLFQGDSITDTNRSREDLNDLGGGYPAVVEKLYCALHPGQNIRFVNRGVGGDTCAMLLARYDEDILAVKPDFISILIGINDTWRRYDSNRETTAETYFQNYETLLKKIKADLPDCKIMMIEPFLLPTDPAKDCFREDLNPKIDRARVLAQRYADFYVPMDGLFFAALTEGTDSAQLSFDGVHPGEQGHALIAYHYLKTIGAI